MTDGRFRAAGALALSGLVIGATMAPAHAAPSWEEAQQRADELGSVAAGLTEDHARLSSRLTSSRDELRSVRDRLDDAVADRRQARRDLVDSLVGDATSGSRDLAADLLAAGRIRAVSLASARDGELATDHRRAHRAVERLSERRGELKRTVRRLGAAHEKQRPRVATANQRAEQAAALVERMREERASRAAEREEQQLAAGGAPAVVAYAMAQVGDAYVYGAGGPDAFDCSGLTSAAWAQAGVSLPRTSSAQMSAGTPVSTSALAPGDLVFYYSPVSHVGIYIGNGQIVHAANPSTGVQVTSLHSMPLTGAVRPG